MTHDLLDIDIPSDAFTFFDDLDLFDEGDMEHVASLVRIRQDELLDDDEPQLADCCSASINRDLGRGHYVGRFPLAREVW